MKHLIITIITLLTAIAANAEKLPIARDSVAVVPSLRAEGDAYLSDYYELKPVCSNDGTLTFTPPLSYDSKPIPGPDYWCRKEASNPIEDMSRFIEDPAFFFFQISQAGTLVLEISQENSDVDYIMWGPFDTPDIRLRDLSYDKIDARVISIQGWTETNTYLPNCYMCSISARESEYARIDNVQEGDYYVLMISNYGRTTNPVSIGIGPGNTAATDCDIVTRCSFTNLEVSTSDVYTNSEGTFFDISVSLWFYNAPEEGDLVITEDISGKTISLAAPFSSPARFRITGIPASGGRNRSLSASFTEGECDTRIGYTAPEIPEVQEHTTAGSFCVGTYARCYVEPNFAASFIWDTGETSSEIIFMTTDGLTTHVCYVYDTNGNLRMIETFEVTGTVCPVVLEETHSNNTVCEPDESNPCNGRISVTASGAVEPYTYLWSTGETTPSISGLCNGTYTITVTDALGTTETLTVEIGTDGGGDTTSDIVLCAGESYDFYGQNISSQGTFTHSVTTSQGCVFNDILNVTKIDYSETYITSDSELCEGEQATLQIGNLPENAVVNWSGYGVEGVERPSVSFVPTQVGTLDYVASINTAGCDTTITATMLVHETPEIFIEMSDEIGVGNLLATASGGESPYSFTLDDNVTSLDGTFAGVSKGYHTATVYDAYNCSADTVLFMDIPLVPAKFLTPDGNGENDVWTIRNISLVPAQVFIYDRHGRLLLHADGNFEYWDGTYNGHPMPSDDYWYVIQDKQTGIKMSGNFTLRR